MQNNNLKDKYNDYLNYSNNQKYAGGGFLNEYNAGGTHESSPHGGIPIGPDSTVEQGEASMNMTPDGTPTKQPTGSKYIFSDRQMWTPEDVKAAGLPPMRGARTASEYMKKLNAKFNDRSGSKDALLTLQEFNKRGQQLAESKRQAEQAQIQAAMQMNAQQAPEDLPTEVPPGMEEYAEQPPQMFMGGQFSRAEAGNLTGGATGIASTMPNARVNFAHGGMFHRYDNGGNWYDNNNPYFMQNPGQVTGPQNQTINTTTPTGNLTGGISAGVTGAMDLMSIAKGNTSPKKGMAIGTGALKGGVAGAQLGTAIAGPGLGTAIGAGTGVLAGAGAGWIGSDKAKEAADKEMNMAITQANVGMPNSQAWSAMGGYITRQPAKYAYGGIHINPANKGKFTASAKAAGHGVQEHAHMVVNNPNSSEVQRKRAQFAINAAKWSHANGGPLDPDPTNPLYKAPGITEVGYGQKQIPLISNINPPTPYGSTTYPGTMFKPTGITEAGYVPKQVPLISDIKIPSVNTTNTEIIASPSNVGSTGNTISKYGKQAANYLNDNAANLMRLSPVISNFIERSAITKPTGTYYSRLNDTFNVPQVDEAVGTNYANRLFSNQRRALGQMGGSQAQQRAALLGLGAQQTDAASKLAYEAANQNRQLALQKQQYQNAIAQYNAGATDRSTEAYRADLGNYETQKSKFTGQIGSDLGEIGKEQLRMKQVAGMYGYTWDGKYMRDKSGKIVTLPTAKTDITSGTVTTPATTTAITAYGGYIKRKPSKY